MNRIPDGSLSYLEGRMCLNGEPFTGIEEFENDEGRGEATYVDGILSGLRRGWFPSGTPYYEEEMLMGVYHGKKREWHPDGQLAEEADYELGVKLRQKLWDEDGVLIEEFELEEDDPAYEELRLKRQTYEEEIEEENRRRKEHRES
jgi:antitoxin component YwqK of YwqJK toxin-antitoxin module